MSNSGRVGEVVAVSVGALAVIGTVAVLLDRATGGAPAAIGAVTITPEIEALLLERGFVKPPTEKPPIGSFERYKYNEVVSAWDRAANKLTKELAAKPPAPDPYLEGIMQRLDPRPAAVTAVVQNQSPLSPQKLKAVSLPESYSRAPTEAEAAAFVEAALKVSLPDDQFRNRLWSYTGGAAAPDPLWTRRILLEKFVRVALASSLKPALLALQAGYVAPDPYIEGIMNRLDPPAAPPRPPGPWSKETLLAELARGAPEAALRSRLRMAEVARERGDHKLADYVMGLVAETAAREAAAAVVSPRAAPEPAAGTAARVPSNPFARALRLRQIASAEGQQPSGHVAEILERADLNEAIAAATAERGKRDTTHVKGADLTAAERAAELEEHGGLFKPGPPARAHWSTSPEASAADIKERMRFMAGTGAEIEARSQQPITPVVAGSIAVQRALELQAYHDAKAQAKDGALASFKAARDAAAAASTARRAASAAYARGSASAGEAASQKQAVADATRTERVAEAALKVAFDAAAQAAPMSHEVRLESRVARINRFPKYVAPSARPGQAQTPAQIVKGLVKEKRQHAETIEKLYGQMELVVENGGTIAAIDAALTAYNSAVVAAREHMGKLVKAAEAKMDNSTESWAESEKGEQYQEWITELEDTQQRLREFDPTEFASKLLAGKLLEDANFELLDETPDSPNDM